MAISNGCMYAYTRSLKMKMTRSHYCRFPLQEYGMNYEAQPLQKHEIAAMKADPKVVERIERSYEIMLSFFGMELVSRETGELRRAQNWQDRYFNLARKILQSNRTIIDQLK